MKIAIILLILTLTAPAREVSVEWEPLATATDNPATPLPDVPVTLRLPAFPDAATTLRIIAISAAGESLPSNTLTIPAIPGTPGGLKFSITLTGFVQ